MRLFADDTANLAITKLADGHQLQEDINALQQADWDMEFNPGKCQILQITNRNCPGQSKSVDKKAMIRNRYNRIPYPALNTKWERDTTVKTALE